jgi:hypothetical protein
VDVLEARFEPQHQRVNQVNANALTKPSVNKRKVISELDTVE